MLRATLLSEADVRSSLERRLVSYPQRGLRVGDVSRIAEYVYRATLLDAADTPVLFVEVDRVTGGVLQLS